MTARKYYSTGQDLTISMVDIKASSMEEAEAVMQRFIDQIAEVMKDEVRWDEADWTIQENTMNAEGTGWEVTDEKEAVITCGDCLRPECKGCEY
jgi:hypothetical protein